MKYHFGFITVITAILLAAGYLAYTFNEQHFFYFQKSQNDIADVLKGFQKKHEPIRDINFAALYGGSGQFQVLHPLLDMPKIDNLNAVPTCGGNEGFLEKGASASCKAVSKYGSKLWESNKVKSKRESLEQFLSGGPKLSEDFLVTPPFVDSSGYSYAYFLAQKGIEPYGTRDWVEKHLSFFKVSELAKILEKFQIYNRDFAIISKLNDNELEEVIRGSQLVMTSDFLFIKDQKQLGFSPLSYLVYDVKDLHADLQNARYDLTLYSADGECLQQIGNTCWTLNSRHALGYLYRYSLAFLILLGLGLFTFVGFYLKHIYNKNKEQQKHRLTLQVLSHEFRTPVSSMLLLIDRLTKDASRFGASDQDAITKMSAEAFRLQRIIEVSKTYLQAEGRRIQFKPIEISSINSWVCDFIIESDLPIRSELLAEDQSFRADPFWLKFVLSSLVQNAFAHGAAPVTIRLRKWAGVLQITVEDQGVCEFDSFGQMSHPFVKSPRSKGMGLGLNIAKYIVDEWGSQIHFSKAPTAFTISMRDNKEVRT